MFVDMGTGMTDGEPALLKSRRHLRLDEATVLWKQLLSYGWQVTTPAIQRHPPGLSLLSECEAGVSK